MVGDGTEQPSETRPEDEAAAREPEPSTDDRPGDQEETSEFADLDYMRSTTREYQGLAEAVAKAGEEEVAQSAVAASMPGVASGVMGFEDVTGVKEEDPGQIEEIDRARRSELALRIGTGLVAVALFFLALAAGDLWATLFVVAVVLIGLTEFYTAVRHAGFVPLGFIGIPAAAGVMYVAWDSGLASVPGVLGASIVLSGLFFVVTQRRYPLANIGVTVLGVAWVAGLASFVVPIFRSESAWSLASTLVVLAAINDIGAYSYGRAFGSRKLAPVLSPNKTLEGLLGATVITALVAAVIGRFGLMEPFTLQSAVALGLLVSFLGPIGDLAESAVKRSIGIKDMGSSLPGHGGVLDRLDGLLFAIPGAYLVYSWFGYL